MQNASVKEKEYQYQNQYETPVFEKEEIPAFPKEIIKEFNKNKICLQCSGCHGCR
jgi:hypothetical protein